METVALAGKAMGTRFELILHGRRAVSLRAAGEEALAEIERLDRQLSIYNPESEAAQINLRAGRQAVRVEPSLFNLLWKARELSRECRGAFDITVAPLVRCWGFMGGEGSMPEPADIEAAKALVGSEGLMLDQEHYSVRFARPGMMIDFGAIGKGWALDRAVDLLREGGVESCLIHGGTSTVYGIGTPPGQDSWRVAIEDSSLQPEREGQPAPVLSVVGLRDEALSVSAVWGKSFTTEGRVHGHVIDPRSGQSVQDSLLAAVIVPSATESDAISTALLTLGASGHEWIQKLRPGMTTFLLGREKEGEAFTFRAKGNTG